MHDNWFGILFQKKQKRKILNLAKIRNLQKKIKKNSFSRGLELRLCFSFVHQVFNSPDWNIMFLLFSQKKSDEKSFAENFLVFCFLQISSKPLLFPMKIFSNLTFVFPERIVISVNKMFKNALVHILFVERWDKQNIF